MRRLSFCAFILALAIVLARGSEAQKKPTSGFSVSQLRALVGSLPQLDGRIEAFRLFRDNSPSLNAAAILTDSPKAGWQLFVFRVGLNGKAKLKWKSGQLDHSFAVSSGDELRFPILATQQTVSFSACAAHACPDVFSALIYVPSLNTAFTETYVRGKISYSPPQFGRHNYGAFRKYLDQQISARLKAAS